MAPLRLPATTWTEVGFSHFPMFRIPALFFFLLAVLSASTAFAQVGGLRGTVTDADFGTGVPGVQISGGGVVGVTDDNGNFFLNEIAPGNHDFIFRKEGFLTESKRGVAVSGGEVRELAVRMEAEVVDLDEFVVSPEELISGESEVAALEFRQDTSSFVDVLGEDFIARSGAGDAGKLLTSVVGTSVVDSKYVVVRGLSDRYNTVFLNGARVPSSDPDRRAVNVDIFPGSLIGSLANSKTFSPNLPGEASGGHIDIRLKGVPEKDFFKFSVGTGINTAVTGHEDFLTYQGGGVGMFGRSNDRRIPAILKNSTRDDLPISPDAPASFQRRAEVARAMDRVFGTTTKEGPTDFSLSASAGKKGEFFGRPMAVIGGITYKRDYEMDPERIYGETTLVSGTTRTIRESEYIGRESSDNLLTAAMITAMWQPDDDDKITATVFTNLAAEDSVGFYQGETLGDIGDPTDNIPPSQADESRVREFIEYTERRLTFLQMAGSHVFEGWKGAELNWNANYGWSSQDQPDIRLSNYASLNGQAFDPVTGEFIETKVFGGVGSNFSGQPWERIWRRLEDTNYSFNMDTKLPLATEGEKEWFMRFGGGFDSSRREYRSDNYALRVPGTTFNQIPHPESLHPDNLKGFTIPDELPVKLLQNTGGDGVYLFRSSTPELYNADQQIVSMFLMTEADLSESVNIGFGGRLEKTDIQLTSPATELFGTDAATGSLLVVDPLTGEVYSQEEIESPISRSEVQLLPAASVKWMLDDNMALRFAASRTLARPTFKELAPVFTRSPGSSRRFFGNRRLQLSDITNYDLRWEWFPKPGDVIAASVFTKTIDRPIEFVNLGNFATVANEVSATVYGFELEVQKSLGDIWPMLDGFSMGTNYSWIFSSMDLTPQSQATREASGLDSRPLQGQPDYLFNWNVNYEHEDFGLTAGLFLNVTGPLLYEAGGRVLNDFGLDVYQRPVTSLDFLLSKEINDHWKVSFKAGNLLDSARSRRYPDNSIFEEYRTGRTYSFAVSAEW